MRRVREAVRPPFLPPARATASRSCACSASGDRRLAEARAAEPRRMTLLVGVPPGSRGELAREPLRAAPVSSPAEAAAPWRRAGGRDRDARASSSSPAARSSRSLRSRSPRRFPQPGGGSSRRRRAAAAVRGPPPADRAGSRVAAGQARVPDRALRPALLNRVRAGRLPTSTCHKPLPARGELLTNYYAVAQARWPTGSR